MDFSAHAFAERCVDHAMARQRRFAGECSTDHGGLEVHAIGALHLRACAGQALFDQSLDYAGVHLKA